ncbi:MAG: hypothetical protein AAGN46_08520 [Acidobacteriota bacterium]
MALFGERKRKGPSDGVVPFEQVAAEAEDLRRTGRPEVAAEVVERAIAARRGAGLAIEPELAKLTWDLACVLERAEASVDAMLRWIEGLLRRGEAGEAIFFWFELKDRLGEAPDIPLALRADLASAMATDGEPGDAADLLDDVPQALADVDRRTIISLARAAVASRAATAPRLVRAALEDSSGEGTALAPEVAAALRRDLAAAEAAGLRISHSQRANAGPIELSSMGAETRRLQLIPARPLAIDGRALRLELAGGATRVFQLQQVQAIATARIDPPAGASYVLIDLLVDSLWSDQEILRTVRLRTRDFDARGLFPSDAPEAADAQLAFARLVDTLLQGSGAQPLPDESAVRGQPFHAFADERRYEATVLEVTA